MGLTAGADDTATATSPAFTPTRRLLVLRRRTTLATELRSEQFDTRPGMLRRHPADSTGDAPATTSLTLGSGTTDDATVGGNSAGGSPTGYVYLLRVRADDHGPRPAPRRPMPWEGPWPSTVGPNDTATATSYRRSPRRRPATGASPGTTAVTVTTRPARDTSSDECVDVSPASTTTVTAPGATSIVLGTSTTDGATVTGNASGGSPTGYGQFLPVRTHGHGAAMYVTGEAGG